MLSWGITGPYLQVLGSDGVTVAKTLVLPEPEQSGGIALTWEHLGIEKKLFDGSTTIVYADNAKRYKPKLVLKYKVYDDLVAACENPNGIGSSDGQTPTLEQLLGIVGLYNAGQLQIARGRSEPYFRVYIKKDVDLKPVAGLVYSDVTLEFVGRDGYPSQDLTSIVVAANTAIPGVTLPVQTLTVMDPITDTGTALNPILGFAWTTGAFSGALTAASFTGAGSGLTGLTAANLTGTIPTAVLANSSLYLGTTAVALNRASGALTLAGITLTAPVIGAATGTSLGLSATLSVTGVATLSGGVSSTTGTFSGAVSASAFTGSGSGLTLIPFSAVSASVLTGLVAGSNTAITAAMTLQAALQNLQAQITGIGASGVTSFNTRTGAVTLTAADINALFTGSLAANGYQKLPGGLILQWGKVTPVEDVWTAFSFPLTFPTACLVITNGLSMGSSNAGDQVGYAKIVSTSQFSVMANNAGTITISWMAIGN